MACFQETTAGEEVCRLLPLLEVYQVVYNFFFSLTWAKLVQDRNVECQKIVAVVVQVCQSLNLGSVLWIGERGGHEAAGLRVDT